MANLAHALPILPFMRRFRHNLRAARPSHKWRDALRAIVNGPSSNPSPSEIASVSVGATDRRVRVMRWVFRRGEETVTCELGLAADASGYEVVTQAVRDGAIPEPEWFKAVTRAFQRQSEIEGELIRAGWSLESYESLMAERPAPKE
jgi:hypothetical protein